MNNIYLVAQREFLVRVRKKSFIVLTLLAPLFMALLMLVPTLMMSLKDDSVKKIAVVDDSQSLAGVLVSDKLTQYVMLPGADIDSLRRNFETAGFYALLHIGRQGDNHEPQELKFYSTKQVGLEVQNKVERALSREVEQLKLQDYNIPGLSQMMEKASTKLKAETVKWGEKGEEQKTHVGVAMGISYAAALLIYMFIFMFGSMVMRGVIEEKTNRIVEVIVSSVKPFQLMMGKILGVAGVALLQFLLWVVLTFALMSVIGHLLPAAAAVSPALADGIPSVGGGSGLQLLSYFEGFNLLRICVCFVLFFMGGYLLYASLFAAVGSAVDSEAETQQLMLPITIPLIVAIMVMINTFQYPDSALSFWFSIIPFTSPVVMMARIPFDVPLWQVALSLALLYVTFVGMVWLSAKIYRTGILMYGKKASFKEMWKWIKYKN